MPPNARAGQRACERLCIGSPDCPFVPIQFPYRYHPVTWPIDRANKRTLALARGFALKHGLMAVRDEDIKLFGGVWYHN